MKVQKKKGAAGNQPRHIPRSDGRTAEADLINLSDVLAEKQRIIQEDLDLRISRHQQWNEGYVDLTKAPLTPPLEISSGSTFRTATTEYLPTPPASISSELSNDVVADVGGMNPEKSDSVAVRYASPSYDGPHHSQPSFRRRYGRGGRLWIDRRGMRLPSRDEDTPMTDRFKFDEDEDEDEVPTYLIDPFDTESMRFRARLFGHPQNQAQLQTSRRAQIEGSLANSQGTSHSMASSPAIQQPSVGD